MAPAKQVAAVSAKKGAEEKTERRPKAEDPNVLWGRRLAIIVLVLMSGAGIWQLYEAIYPDWPARMPTDAGEIGSIIFGGQPAIILCRNRTTVDSAAPTAKRAARSLGIASYLAADCHQKLSSGQTLFERLQFSPSLNPAWGLVVDGRKPLQLPVNLIYRFDELASKIKPLVREPRHTRIDSDADLDACTKDKAGGCIIVYSSKDKEALNTELPPLVKSHRNVTFAIVHSHLKSLRTGNEAMSAMLKGAVAQAKALTSGTSKAAVIVSMRRVPPSLVSGDTSRLLVTALSSDGPAVGESDIARMMATAARSLALLKQQAADAEAASASADAVSLDSSIEALLARDEEMAQTGSVLLSKGEITIGVVPSKNAPKAKASNDGGEENLSAEERRERRNAARTARDAATYLGKAAGEVLTEEEEEELQRLKEKAARETMAREEAESAHFAAAAEGGEDFGSASEDEQAPASHADVDLDLDAQDAEGDPYEGDL